MNSYFKQEEMIKAVKDYLREIDYFNFSVSYILSKTNNYKLEEIMAVARNDDNCEEVIGIKLVDDKSIYYPIADWDFNVDSYLLEDLENGYEFVYAPLQEHYNIWCQIDEWRDEIDHSDGLQKYLSSCQKQNVTKEAIALLGFNKVDITDLYQEVNGNYKIIADMSCGNKAVVLAYNKNAPAQYVTWRTTKNRIRGYDIGCYFTTFKDAYENFEKDVWI